MPRKALDETTRASLRLDFQGVVTRHVSAWLDRHLAETEKEMRALRAAISAEHLRAAQRYLDDT